MRLATAIDDGTNDDAIEWLGNRSIADRLCLEHYEGKRTLEATLRVAKRHHGSEVLAMVKADLSKQEATAA